MAAITFRSVLEWSDDQCREFLEAQRWPDGPVCPKCGANNPYRIERRSKTKNVVKHLYRCRACRKDYTATVGTIFEDSKIPLQKWFAAIYLMAASKKGMSAFQLHRMLWGDDHPGAYRSAWFMCHRIREAMKSKDFTPLKGIVEVDETYIGGKPRGHRTNATSTMSERIKEAWARKTPVFGIKERGGRVRAQVMPKINAEKVERAVWHGVDRQNARLMTDEHMLYYHMSKMLPHDVIRHKSEYVRGDIHTQGIESFWAVLKRGLIGTFHHVDAGYLGCYVDEFAFRNDTRKVSDAQRFASLVGQVSGRRVTWFCETEQPENPYA